MSFWTQTLVERQVYWPETMWTPVTVPGVYVRGDQTVLSADGAITFLDVHVVPGSTRVFPFGEWSDAHVGAVQTSLAVEEHGPEGAVPRTVQLVLDGGMYGFDVTPGTERVVM